MEGWVGLEQGGIKVTLIKGSTVRREEEMTVNAICRG